METFTNEVMIDLLGKSLEASAPSERGWVDMGEGPGSAEAKYIDWLTISNNAKSVVEDVEKIRNHPLVPGNIPIYGFIFDVKTGKLIEIPEATKKGKAA